MKVYSWKTLLVTIISGALFIWKFKDIMAGDVSAFIFMMLMGYLLIKGLGVSFTKEGYKEDKRRVESSKRIFRKVFGPWALIAPWGHLILIFLAATSFHLLPSQMWLSIFLFMGSLVYVIACGRLVRRQMKLEEEIGKE